MWKTSETFLKRHVLMDFIFLCIVFFSLTSHNKIGKFISFRFPFSNFYVSFSASNSSSVAKFPSREVSVSFPRVIMMIGVTPALAMAFMICFVFLLKRKKRKVKPLSIIHTADILHDPTFRNSTSKSDSIRPLSFISKMTSEKKKSQETSSTSSSNETNNASSLYPPSTSTVPSGRSCELNFILKLSA